MISSYSQLNCNNWLRVPSFQSYVGIGDLDIPGKTITVEALFTRTAPYTGGYILAGDLVSKHNTPSDVNYLLRPNNTAITTSDGFFITPPICDIELNRTYHAAMTYDGVTLKFYRNGFLMSSTPATGDLFQNDFETRMGLYDAIVTNTQMIGYINEVRIWNIVRSQADIQAYMGSSLPNPPAQAGLLAYYTFDNLLNKQGNAAWNGVLGGNASISQSNVECVFTPDSCNYREPDVINDYTEVLSVDPCKNALIVADATEYNPGDTVLLIQMKGAVIDSSNTTTFGDITDLKNAGNYEFNYIKSVDGNVIELLNVILREYDFSNGKVQLVRVPYFQDYTIDNKLTAMPWDGSKGGVLAFNVQNTLELKNDIDVSGKGLRGGTSLNSSVVLCNIRTWFNAPQTNGGGEKGEGVHNLSNSKNYGRGAPSIGGGGGNAHNCGGGGGANAGAGGNGGDQWEGCKTLTENVGGRGGKALINNATLNRLYLGGGGGMGHGNDQNEYAAGNGGGIIIISAGTLIGNNHVIQSNGEDANLCINTANCNDGMSGAGAGGSILLDINNVNDHVSIEAKGGKGGNTNYLLPTNPTFKVGPGGGGGGGFVAFSQASTSSQYTVDVSGGKNGVNLNQGNNPYGATSGNDGAVLTSFDIFTDNVLFEENIDSVRIDTSIISCNTIDFAGLAYVNAYPVASWQWYFGDGNTAFAQNVNHIYANSGDYTTKLVVTDINGCSDSMELAIDHMVSFDFNYEQDICNPLNIQFSGLGGDAGNVFWDFGDGHTVTDIIEATHAYSVMGSYIVRYGMGSGVCADTISKTISLDIIPDDIILTTDTTICEGTVKQLLTAPSLDFCWTPTAYLDDPGLRQPITSTPDSIAYYFTAKITGINLVTNGDFSQGNTGFSSAYYFANSNQGEEQYFIGTNPQAWNAGMEPCVDHTTGNGNMMIVKGGTAPDVDIWKQTIMVLPNTNYAFSTWIQAMSAANPAVLQFSINGRNAGEVIAAGTQACTWTQFHTTWNSGSNTTLVLSIVTKNNQAGGSDFAIDDISFAPVFIKKDSVIIRVEKPVVKTNADTAVCAGSQVQLIAGGAQTYIWSPSTDLSGTTIADPLAFPQQSMEYIVTGTTVNGCMANDTVNVNVFAKSVINTSPDVTVCKNTPVQLFVNGGVHYNWTPAGTLSDPGISNPVATPAVNTVYYVEVKDANTCTYLDSVELLVHPDPVFTLNAPITLCLNDSMQLDASGGDIYSWQPSAGLSNAGIAAPMTSPVSTTNYTVTITEMLCNQSATLSVRVTVLPLPNVQATRSNDLDCSIDRSQLAASGANSYRWTPAATLSNPRANNPVATPIETTMYYVTGIDRKGCTNYDSVIVKVENINKGGYLMPNAFTPNNDGSNDCYGLKYWGIIYEAEFSIFNRWGERVFFTRDPNKCWDGRYKGVPQDPGVFVYMIKAKTNCEPSVFRKGTFVLIR